MFAQAIGALHTAVLKYLPQHFTPSQLKYGGARPLQLVSRKAVANALSNNGTLPATLAMEPRALNALR